MKDAHSGPVRIGILCFLLGLAAALAAAIGQRRINDDLVAEHFDEVARDVTDNIALRMRTFEYGLRGMRGVVVAQDGLPTLDQVRRYARSRDIDQEFRGARGFGVIWRVPRQDEAAYAALMRREGRPDFAVRQIVPHEGDRYVITYIEPEPRNSQAVGLDVASEARRRDAADAAQATGRPAITEPITLVQASGRTLRSFLLLLPIQGASPRVATPGKSRQAAGWSYAPVVIDEVIATLHLPENLVWLELRDADSKSDAVFYASEGAEPDSPDLPSSEIHIPMFNRKWAAHVRARPALIEELRLTSPYLIGAAGTLTASLLGVVAFLLAQRRLRNQALLLERAARAAIVDASDDGIVCIRLDGTITEWNRGAERMFGFGADAVVGRPIRQVLPPAWLDEHVAILAGARSGKPIVPFETQRRHRDGFLVDVSVSAVPIHDADGRLTSVAKTFRDIRATKAAQRELEALNAKLESQVRERTTALDRALHDLRSIVDALPSMIGYWDRNQRNRMANRAYARWFGVDPASLAGKHMAELLGPELYRLNLPHIQAALDGEAQTFERSIVRPDNGGMRHSLAHYLPDVIDGIVQGFYVLVHDVTELHEQRAALEAEKRDKAALLATLDAHAIVSVTDRDGVIVSVNERFCRISGYAASDLVGHTHRVVDSGMHSADVWQGMWRTIRDGATWHGEICNRARDGTTYWVDSVVAPFMDSDGRLEKIIMFSADITARKRAELASTQALATLESVLQSATQVAIVATDPAGTVTLFNRGAESLIGRTADEVVGKRQAAEWLATDELGSRAAALGQSSGREIAPQALLTDEAMLDKPFDCHVVRKDGGRIPVTLSVSRIQDGNGATLGFIHVAYDIRDRLAHEAALQQAATAAQQASLAKSRFLANMSHEIRTPLNAVIGLAHLLGRTVLDSEQASYVANIGAAGDTLLTVVSDVLDLSKIEAGEMPLEHVTFSLRDLCSDLSSLFSAQARTKGLALHLSPESTLPDALRGDPTRLRQILVNLMGNAIKFTERGSVELAVRSVQADADGCRLRFEVRDTGVGIDEAAVERLFLPFAQADASTTRRFGGTGLGLSIVRNLVHMMGGTIDVRSTPGAGSSFQVELPFEAGDPASLLPKIRRSESGPRLPGARALLVDDSEINLTVAGKVLEMEGAIVTKAGDGAQAVRIVAERPDIQVVLMDIQMPVMDGIEATRTILREAHRPAPVILALTAGNTETERRRALDAGFQDVLSKPIDPERLIQALQHVLVMQQTPATAPAGAVVDDWLAIEGIDPDLARSRFGDDADLFFRMLDSVLDECDAASALPAGTPNERQVLARLMHKLKGSAGTLAANAMAAAAERIEIMCAHGAHEGIGPALDELGRIGGRLRAAAAGVGRGGDEALAVPTGAALDAEGLGRLVQSLQNQELRALDLFQRLAPAMQTLLEPETFGSLSYCVQNLQFDKALVLLRDAHVADCIAGR